jgi:hypothetical protein
MAEAFPRRLHQESLAARQVEVEKRLLHLHQQTFGKHLVEAAVQDALALRRRALDVQAVGQLRHVAHAVAVGHGVGVHQAHRGLLRRVVTITVHGGGGRHLRAIPRQRRRPPRACFAPHHGDHR